MSHYRRQYAARRRQARAPGRGREGRESTPRAPEPAPASRADDSGAPHPAPTGTKEEKTIAPEGAACYFCLDGGPDEEGRPLLRDCSCRGDHAGFVHLTCLIKYAEHKSREFRRFSAPSTENLWLVCPHCHQSYQNQLEKDMSSAFLSFAEKNRRQFDNSKGKKHFEETLFTEIRVMDAMKAYSACRETIGDDPLFPWMVGRDAIAHRILSTVERLKKELRMTDEWMHRPKSSLERSMYALLRGAYEAHGYGELGRISYLQGTDVGIERAMPFLEKARTISAMLGIETSAKTYEHRIDALRYIREGKSTALQVSKDIYENYCRVEDEFSPNNIMSGVEHVYLLKKYGNIAEAVELATKLVTSSRRVHGPQHKCTVDAENVLNEVANIDEGGGDQNQRGQH